MNIKTFQGRNMAEALAAVKRQFGRHAVILGTRTRAKGGLFGIGSHAQVEITAARDLADLPNSLRSGAWDPAPSQSNVAPHKSRAPTVEVRPSMTESSDTLLTEMSALRSVVSELVRETKRDRTCAQSEAVREAYQELIENSVAAEIADELVTGVQDSLSQEELRNPMAVRRKLADAVGAMVPTVSGIDLPETGRPRVIALVGPTGVGKTTTVAKLAANLALRENRSVGLITIDTYRIAAVEQLRTYAQIMGIPLKVASKPDQFGAILSSMADRDVILVDTAGRSQRDTVKIDELRSFFASSCPDETHLVLSSTCCERVLLEAVERFAVLGADRIIFTKLDEAVGFGVMLKCLKRAKAKLSYVTTGQDVPDDIEIGRAERLVDLIVRGSERESLVALAG